MLCAVAQRSGGGWRADFATCGGGERRRRYDTVRSHLAGLAPQFATGRKRTRDTAARGGGKFDLAPGSSGLDNELGHPDDEADADAGADAEADVEDEADPKPEDKVEVRLLTINARCW